jgi:AraC-like DNA-binding protein
MLHTTINIPRGILKDYILFVAIREFDCHQSELLKPVHANHEIHMMFLIDCKMHDFKNEENQRPKYIVRKSTNPGCNFAGLLTSMKGSIVFKGHIKLMTIQFKPTGFYRLFGIPPSEITDCLGDGCDLFSREILELHEQLHEAKTSVEMFQLTEQYLMEQLHIRRIKSHISTLEKASEYLINDQNPYSIKELAYHSNMSLKTFERKFVEQVGISPKLFARIRRFNAALDLKTYQPDLSWLDICYKAGYYDQMHLIKDFKVFAGLPPSVFYKNSPPLYEVISKEQ